MGLSWVVQTWWRRLYCKRPVTTRGFIPQNCTRKRLKYLNLVKKMKVNLLCSYLKRIKHTYIYIYIQYIYIYIIGSRPVTMSIFCLAMFQWSTIVIIVPSPIGAWSSHPSGFSCTPCKLAWMLKTQHLSR